MGASTREQVKHLQGDLLFLQGTEHCLGTCVSEEDPEDASPGTGNCAGQASPLCGQRSEVINLKAEMKPGLIEEGAKDYEEWHASLVDTPVKQARYEQTAAKSD